CEYGFDLHLVEANFRHQISDSQMGKMELYLIEEALPLAVLESVPVSYVATNQLIGSEPT
ncbi:9321_t:CDS:1, partial [Acaulospora colombiana]